MKHIFMETRLWSELTGAFLEEISERYHYETKDMPRLRRVASDMMSCMKGQDSVFFELPEDGEDFLLMPVVMTLGGGVDLLQERYQKEELLLEAYMIENIGGELLMRGYGQLEQWLEENTGWSVESYHFFGSEDAFPLEEMTRVLSLEGQRKVRCTADYCLMPRKSTVFYAALCKKDAKKRETETACGKICASCRKKESCGRSEYFYLKT